MSGGGGIVGRDLLGGRVSVDQVQCGLQPRLWLLYSEYKLYKSLKSRHFV